MVSAANASELWERYKATKDPSMRKQLILLYAPLVKYVVGRMAIGMPNILDSEDVIGHATIGMIEAMERFDPGRGFKFETFAIPRIRGSVLDAVRRLGIHHRGSRRKMKEIEAAISLLQDRDGRTPSDQEVAEYLGMRLEEYQRELVEASLVVIPLDSALRVSNDDESLSLSDVIEDETSPSPPVEAEAAEMRAALREALNELPERERQLISLYYHEELTLREISQVFEVSESRVCQLHAKAILKLRRALSRVGLLVRAGTQAGAPARRA